MTLDTLSTEERLKDWRKELAWPPPHQPATIRELTTILMKRIAAMLPPDHRGVYA
jgi:hypothetical protein